MNRVSTRAANYLEKQNVEIDRGKKEEVMAMAMKGEIRGGRAPIKNDQNFHLLNDSTIYSWRPLVWSGQREGEWSWHCVGETEIGRERERERQRERDRERDRQTERERDRQREIVCR